VSYIEGEDGIQDGEAAEEVGDENQLDVMNCIDRLMEVGTQAGDGGNDTIQVCGIWQQQQS
jgi:hypothetical protein